MTTPNIVQVPGVGQEVAQGLAPFIQAMQFNKHLQQQQQAEEQRVAAELYARGLQTAPGFENTPAGQALEMKLGVPGLGASISKARTAEERRKVEDINTFVEGLSGIGDQAKSGLRASLVAGSKGATSDVQNALFSAMAGGADLTILEKARLDNLRANTNHIQAEIDKMKREPGPHDQLRAAQILGVNTGDMAQGGSNSGDFVQGTNYISVLEDQLKQNNKEADPARAILNTSISLMTSNKDLLGRPALTPQEAFSQALGLVKNVYPKTAGTIQFTPATEQTLAATRAATLMWQGLRLDENTLKDAQGRVMKKFKTSKEIHDYIGAEIKHLYPLVDEPSLNALMDIVQRRITESF